MNDAQVDVPVSVEASVPTWSPPRPGLLKRLLYEGDPSEGTPVQFGLGGRAVTPSFGGRGSEPTRVP